MWDLREIRGCSRCRVSAIREGVRKENETKGCGYMAIEAKEDSVAP
jgi:hypothetical protein